MAENWDAIAAEVAEGIRSVGSTDAGFPVTLRMAIVSGGNPWDPGSGTESIVYKGFVGFETVQEIRDINGTLTGQTKRTITVDATAGVGPRKGDKIAPGVPESEANEDSYWLDILAVRPLAPAGIAVMYEIDIAA